MNEQEVALLAGLAAGGLVLIVAGVALARRRSRRPARPEPTRRSYAEQDEDPIVAAMGVGEDKRLLPPRS